ncbi:histidinol dehydrogenase, partial [Candidatus Gottesmanbacteria bacterium]|nr:histidinol dehydrogenase [Candidatus Gottesmanbacteria bacterium]
MKIIKLSDLSKKNYQRIICRSSFANKDIIPQVKRIMSNVKTCGDRVILEKYQKRYGQENYKSIQVSKDEIKKAYKNVDRQFLNSISQMIKNITAVHQAQLPKKKDTVIYPEKGISVWRVWRPVEKVGLYIPGGKAIYPSSVLMSAIPAQIAGCREIVMCSPPGSDGQIPAATLVTADMTGLAEIFKVGGAEAIAALIYGTKSIPKVYKIFGAGNSYVTAAKMLAMEEIAIDMPAGPSEIFIIADETANPSYIAADLLADGEHGEDSACVLLTTSWEIANQTGREIEKQLNKLFTRDRASESLKRYGLIGVVDSLD